MAEGGCHCGAIRYSLSGEPRHSSVCHCESCRRTTGGLATAWLGYPTESLTVEQGEPKSYNSSGGVERRFCGACGTSLFYFNESAMPGIVDVLTVTLDITDEAVREVAKIAAQVNESVENIGARRLQTVMEKLLEELSFEAEDHDGETVTIDAAYVRDRLEELAEDSDLSKYIL